MDRIWTKHYDPGVPADLQFKPQTLVAIFEAACREFPTRPAVTLKGKTLTYAQLLDHVNRFAAALAGLGVTTNSRVALWMPNLPQFIIAYFATLKLGAQAVGTNPLYVEREIEHQFNDAAVDVVVTLDFLWWGKLRGILGRTPVKHVVVTSIPDYLKFPLNLLAPLKLKKTGQYVKVPREPKVHFFKELVAAGGPAVPAPTYGWDHPALLLYTGGTTGVSKGAVLTHRNLSCNVQQAASWFPKVDRGHEVLLACLPYFHSFGNTISLLWPVFLGAHIVLAPNPRDIGDLVASIRKYGVTLFPAVPALYNGINNFPGIDKLDISSIKYCFSGSAPLPVEVMSRFQKLTGGKITEGFGLTETSPVTHVNPLSGLQKPGSIGIPVPDTDIKIVDAETGTRELGLHEEGELCIRGPQVMSGYWNRPDETAQMIRDGWLHTGDLARLDDDGYAVICGRKKDLIIVSGYNVYPDEVDQVLFAHPKVLEAATIGIPDPQKGERIKSFVVLQPGQQATTAELLEYCRKELAPYKVPKEIAFLSELPKSAMLKILRRELRAKETTGVAHAVR
ncbi:MAG: long-chain fatty acid--CoA ligase [Gemmatimonadota bacterium]|nr:long-chain fatty acid--CoA ligase [Gemmatimonadota bacterium]MDH4349996.1 long-chain fatty acid--CoA ligase [Gemmatimonadota bacterium]MDH5196159.1 long-chain fatty acid--CoA ligase [Gemmatimonadota bacterium]